MSSITTSAACRKQFFTVPPLSPGAPAAGTDHPGHCGARVIASLVDEAINEHQEVFGYVVDPQARAAAEEAMRCDMMDLRRPSGSPGLGASVTGGD